MRRLESTFVLNKLSGKLGSFEIRPSGWVDFKNCPFCGSQKRKFGIDSRSGICSCFRCGTTASYSVLLKTLGLLELQGKQIVPVGLLLAKKVEEFTPIDLKAWTPILEAQHTHTGKELLRYALERHVDPELWEVGLMENDDQHLGRLAFLFREYGVPVYYQARAVLGSQHPKTLNPPAGVGYPRNQAFFGHDLWEPGMTLVVSEGPFDAVACTDLEEGYLGTCLLGLSRASPSTLAIKPDLLPSQWVSNARRLGVERVVVFLDRDAQVQASHLAIATYKAGFRTWLVEWPKTGKKKDPSELGPDGSLYALSRWAVELTDSNLVTRLLNATPTAHDRRWASKRRKSGRSPRLSRTPWQRS